MTHKQYAYFAVDGEFDPAEVTARVGVPPTDAWRRGDRLPRTGRERTFSRRALHSRLDRGHKLEAHVRDVLAQLDARPEGFAAVAREFGGWMQLVGYFRQTYPGLHFEADATAGLARYTLAVDFDFYWLGAAAEG